MFSKLTNYLKDVRLEMRKVEWLSRKEWVRHTIIVIVAALAVAIILSGFDISFKELIRKII